MATRNLAASLRVCIVVAAFATTLGSACSDAPRPRPELLVYVDTDAHVSGELFTRSDVSPDATVDTLRIDVLSAERQTNLFVVSSPSSWPVSFGVARGASATVTLRLRLFRSLFAASGTENGVSTLDPPAEVAIDRVAILSLPDSGLSRISILLANDCLGTAPSFLSPETTCLDKDHLAVDPTQGVIPLGDAPPVSRVGTWRSAVEVPCMAKVSADRVCVPGGFDIMGDVRMVGLVGTDPRYDPIPYRPVVVSPFVLDKYEFTVGRLRKLIASGTYHGAAPALPSASNPIEAFCTWRGATTSTIWDDYPVNCIGHASALEACRASGGTLPTEAQWNHEARGRGRRWLFPWGNADATCCAESEGRSPLATACHPAGPEPSASHPKRAGACDGLGDVSIDGAFDLGGSVTEAMLDTFDAYGGPCWKSSAILFDPVCTTVAVEGTIARGGDWQEGSGTTVLPLRYPFFAHAEYGFRCAYPVGGP